VCAAHTIANVRSVCDGCVPEKGVDVRHVMMTAMHVVLAHGARGVDHQDGVLRASRQPRHLRAGREEGGLAGEGGLARNVATPDGPARTSASQSSLAPRASAVARAAVSTASCSASRSNRDMVRAEGRAGVADEEKAGSDAEGV
jgi:hypothetical protein